MMYGWLPRDVSINNIDFQYDQWLCEKDYIESRRLLKEVLANSIIILSLFSILLEYNKYEYFNFRINKKRYEWV